MTMPISVWLDGGALNHIIYKFIYIYIVNIYIYIVIYSVYIYIYTRMEKLPQEKAAKSKTG